MSAKNYQRLSPKSLDDSELGVSGFQSRPYSVISDICGEETASHSAQTEDASFQSVAVSDVLSPVRKFRGRGQMSSPEKPSTENTDKLQTINTDGELTQHDIEEAAANLSYSALQAAIADLSIDDPAQFATLDPADATSDNQLFYTPGKTKGFGDDSEIAETIDDVVSPGFKPLLSSVLHDTEFSDIRALPQYEIEQSLAQFKDTFQANDTGISSALSQRESCIVSAQENISQHLEILSNPSSRRSSRESKSSGTCGTVSVPKALFSSRESLASTHSQVLEQHPIEKYLKQHRDSFGSSSGSSEGRRSLHSVSQYPLSSDKTVDETRRQSAHADEYTKSVFVKPSKIPYDSGKGDSEAALSQYFIDSTSDRASSGPLHRLSIDSKSSHSSEPGSSEGKILILDSNNSSKDSRPCTIIERPRTEGYNQSDSDSQHSSLNKSKKPTSTAQFKSDKSKPRRHEVIDSTFNHTVLKGSDSGHRETLGDSLLVLATTQSRRAPVSSSTPLVSGGFASVSKLAERVGGIDDLTRRLSMSGGNENEDATAADVAPPTKMTSQLSDVATESESDTNIMKVIRKAGITDYVSAEQRQLLLDQTTDSVSNKGNREQSPFDFHRVDNESQDEETQELAALSLKSPQNWRELIPDTPNANPLSPNSVESGVEHFSYAGNTNQNEQDSSDRHSVASSPKSNRSTEGSAIPRPVFLREKTNYDIYSRGDNQDTKPEASVTKGDRRSPEEASQSGAASVQEGRKTGGDEEAVRLQIPGQPAGAGRVHTSSIGSADTLLGGYEARDAVSLASVGSRETIVASSASDDNRRLSSENPESITSTAEQHVAAVSGRRSLGSSDATNMSTYKDEKWGSKVSGMLEGISRRQNLSARVASILAHPSPAATRKAQQDQGSNLPLQHSRSSGNATPASSTGQQSGASTPQLSLTAKSAHVDSPALSSMRDGGQDSTITPAERTAQENTLLASQSGVETPQKSGNSSATTEDEDVQRMTEEYKAILKGVSGSVGRNQEEEQDQKPQNVQKKKSKKSEGRQATKSKEYGLDPNDLSSGEQTEDSLDRDVKRILSKYGRDVATFQSPAGKESNVSTSTVDRRQSPAGSAYDTEDTLAQRVQGLLRAKSKSKGNDKASRNTTRDSESAFKSANITDRSLTIPGSDLDSTGKSENDTIPVDLGSLKSRLQRALQDDSDEEEETYNHAYKPEERQYAARMAKDSNQSSPRGPLSARSNDPLNDRVRKILAETTHLESSNPTTASASKRHSLTGSPSSSIDYHNLERDLDEIQSHLESLKGETSGGHQSDVSEREEELRRFAEGRVDDETLRKARALLAADSDSERPSTSSSRLEPEGQGQSASPVPRPALSPLLTSGLVPIDVALDMIHCPAPNHGNQRASFAANYRSPFYSSRSENHFPQQQLDNFQFRRRLEEDEISNEDEESQNYSYNNSGTGGRRSLPVGGDGGSGSMNNTADTERMQREATVRYNAFFTPDVLGTRAATLSYEPPAVDPLLATGVSATDSLVDREVMEINKVARDDSVTPGRQVRGGLDNGYQGNAGKASPSRVVPTSAALSRAETGSLGVSLNERVARILASERKSSDEVDRPRSSPGRAVHYNDLNYGAENDNNASPAVGATYDDSSLNISYMSPLTKKPFTAFSNARNLFTNQLNKVSVASFDTSLHANSPLKQSQAASTNLASLTYGRLSPTSRARMEEPSGSVVSDSVSLLRDQRPYGREAPPYGREKSPVLDSQTPSVTEGRLEQDLRRPSPVSRELSPPEVFVQSRGSSPQDGVLSSRSSSDRRLRPYRPPGSKMTYYVESGADGEANTSLACYSETTVESTHPGSDDAVGPTLPASAYGSRRDPPRDQETAPTGVYTKETSDLGTIQEHSLEENELRSSSHRQSSTQSSQRPASQGSQRPASQGSHRPASKGSHRTQTSLEQLAAANTVTFAAVPSRATPTTAAAAASLGNQQQQRTATPTESRYRHTEEWERSFSKTQDWLNGNWPSKEDIAAASPEKTHGSLRARSESHERNRHSDASDRDTLTPPVERRESGVRVSNTDRRTHSQLYSTNTPASAAMASFVNRAPLMQSTPLTTTAVKPATAVPAPDVPNAEPPQPQIRDYRSAEVISDATSSAGSYASASGRPARAMYADYSDKCHQLQSRYRDLKHRAEQAISTLISGKQEQPSRADTLAEVRDTLRAANHSHTTREAAATLNSVKEQLEFGTPKRLGSSKLGLESLNDTTASRKSRQGGEDGQDSGMRSLNSTAKSDASGGSRPSLGGSQDFLKYHSGQQQRSGSGARGADYWSSLVARNYDDLSQPLIAPPGGRASISSRNYDEFGGPTGDARASRNFDEFGDARTSRHYDDLDAATLREEREARAVAARQCNSGRSDDEFAALTPDMENDEERTSHASKNSTGTPNRARSPYTLEDPPHHAQKSRASQQDYDSKPAYNEASRRVVAESPDEREAMVSAQRRSGSGPQEPNLTGVSEARLADERRIPRGEDRLEVGSASRKYNERVSTSSANRAATDDLDRSRTYNERVSKSTAHRAAAADDLDRSRPRDVGDSEAGKDTALAQTSSTRGYTRPSEVFLRSLPPPTKAERSLPPPTKAERSLPPPTKAEKAEVRREQKTPETDMQALWEEFSSLQQTERRQTSELSYNNGRSVSIDLQQLTDVLTNPTKHLIKNAQRGTVFDQDQSPRSQPDPSQTPHTSSRDRRDVNARAQETRQAQPKTASAQEKGQPNQREARSESNRDSGRSGRDNANSDNTGGQGTRQAPSGTDNSDNRDDDNNDDRRSRSSKSHDKHTQKRKAESEETTEEEENIEEIASPQSGAMETGDVIVDSSQKRKIAWIIKDEELLSIPEENTLDSVSSDFTTSSEIDSDGKLVTKTTKRHLPNDPKLLKLQQKIAKQKEKFKRVQLMAQRRHNKIVQLEQLETRLEQRACAEEEQHTASGRRSRKYDDDVTDEDLSSPQAEHPTATTFDSLGTVTSKTTSTPSQVDGDHRRLSGAMHGDSTLGISDITTASTLTGGGTTLVSEDTNKLLMGSPPAEWESESEEQSVSSSSVCRCCHKRRARSADTSRRREEEDGGQEWGQSPEGARQHGRSPPHKISRSQSPVSHSSPKKRRHVDLTAAHTYPTPTSRHRKGEKQQLLVIREPAGMKLREVDYNSSISPSKAAAHTAADSRRERGKGSIDQRPVYMEIEVPKAVPKTKPARRQAAAKESSAECRRETEPRKERSARREASTSYIAKPQLTNTSVQVSSKASTREFGATCPTPPVERPVKKVTMVSEAVQTEAERKSARREASKPASRRRAPEPAAARQRRNHSPGMFTPEGSEEENEDPELLEQQQWHVTDSKQSRGQSREQSRGLSRGQGQEVGNKQQAVQPPMSGVSWFMPMKEARPWKQPLRERQAQAVARETWPQMDEHSRRALHDLAFRKTDELGRVPSDYFPHRVPEDEEEEKQLTGLQRAFEKRMQVFISKSRERQRLVRMRAQDRRVSAVHGRDREVLFRVDHRRQPNVNAHPLSDLHFAPKKRIISKTEMKEISATKYKKLPEVVRACETKKREEFYKTNRMRAQVYKQKILSHVLKKRAPQQKV